MKEIGSVLGYKVVINDIEFDQILEEVGKNTLAVGAAGMTKNEARDKIALSSISYATSVQYVITVKDALEEQKQQRLEVIEKIEELAEQLKQTQKGLFSV